MQLQTNVYSVSSCVWTSRLVADGGVHRAGEKPGAGVQRQGGSGPTGEGSLQ